MTRRKIFRRLVRVEEVLSIIDQHYSHERRVEEVGVERASGRVLAEDVICGIDVPSFERAATDGFAVRARDSYGANEGSPVELRVIGRSEAGYPFPGRVGEGEAVEAATGAPMPAGANAVVPVEDADRSGDWVLVFKSLTPGENVQGVGTDLNAGETLLFSRTRLGPRELGIMAATGLTTVKVFGKPRVAIFSTGDELVPPGKPLRPGRIYDSNTSALLSAVREDQGDPKAFGVLRDDVEGIERGVRAALGWADLVILSGSTSSGAGDVMYRAMYRMEKPGLLVQGVAMKPGKPTIVGKIGEKFVIGLPGYPTSALIAYSRFVSPLIRRMAGLKEERRPRIRAKIARRVSSVPGRRHMLAVNLIRGGAGQVIAFPLPTGLEAISTLGRADGFVEIPEEVEYVDGGEEVLVTPFEEGLRPADLSIMGSHCPGAELALRMLGDRMPGLRFKSINVGSLGGVKAIGTGEADLAGVHALDPETRRYNAPLIGRYELKGVALLVRGYTRAQGLMVAGGNPKGIRRVEDLLRPGVRFVNRSRGTGTRILFDSMLNDLARKLELEVKEVRERMDGYDFERKTHAGVAEAVARGQADAGLGIEFSARLRGLDFVPLAEERYDFLARLDRLGKRAVKQFLEVLRSGEFRDGLSKMPGYETSDDIGRFAVGKPGRRARLRRAL